MCGEYTDTFGRKYEYSFLWINVLFEQPVAGVFQTMLCFALGMFLLQLKKPASAQQTFLACDRLLQRYGAELCGSDSP